MLFLDLPCRETSYNAIKNLWKNNIKDLEYTTEKRFKTKLFCGKCFDMGCF
jgi:hypothetical protein